MIVDKPLHLARLGRAKVGIGVFMAAYVAVALVGDRYSPIFEFYPVFSWSLFSDSPGVKSLWEIRIHAIGDRSFSPPRDFYSLPETFSAARNHDSGLLKAANRLGQAILSSPGEVPARRRMIEKRILDGIPDIDYELVGVWYRPLERWRDGTVLHVRSYGRFLSGQAQ